MPCFGWEGGLPLDPASYSGPCHRGRVRMSCSEDEEGIETDEDCGDRIPSGSESGCGPWVTEQTSREEKGLDLDLFLSLGQ